MTENDAQIEDEAAAAEPSDAASDDDDTPPWYARHVTPLVIALVVAMTVIAGFRFGIAPALLVLAASALLTVVGLIFRSFQLIAEPSDDALVAEPTAVPTVAEDHKRSALRALKDIDYERSVGNITDADYAELLARYRSEAKRSMREVDEERRTRRARAEQLVNGAVLGVLGPAPAPKKVADPAERQRDAARKQDASREGEGAREPLVQTLKCPECNAPLRRAHSGLLACPFCEAPLVIRAGLAELSSETRAPSAAVAPVAPVEEPATTHDRKCATCGVRNDEDAKFCKGCGGKVSIEAPSAAPIDREGSA